MCDACAGPILDISQTKQKVVTMYKTINNQTPLYKVVQNMFSSHKLP